MSLTRVLIAVVIYYWAVMYCARGGVSIGWAMFSGLNALVVWVVLSRRGVVFPEFELQPTAPIREMEVINGRVVEVHTHTKEL